MSATPKSPVHSRQNFKTKLLTSSGGHLDKSSFLFLLYSFTVGILVSLGPSGYFFRLEEGNYAAKQRGRGARKKQGFIFGASVRCIFLHRERKIKASGTQSRF